MSASRFIADDGDMIPLAPGEPTPEPGILPWDEPQE